MENIRFRKLKTIPFKEFIQKEENAMTLLKIVPDKSVSNNQNDKFWRLMYELMELDHSLRNRITRNGLSFKYRMRDMIWFEMVARCQEKEVVNEEGETEIEYERKIDFFLAVPTKFAKTIKQKLYDKQPQITVDEVELKEVEISPKADMVEYRYSKNNIFSLRCNNTEQTSPISSIMNTVHDLSENDMMRFSIGVERVSRKNWHQLSSYAWDQLKAKRVPTRARFDPKRIARKTQDLIKFGFFEIKDLLDDILQAIQNAFFKSDTPIEKRSKDKSFHSGEYEELMSNGELSNDTRKKRTSPVFKTKIRLAVDSNNRSRSHMVKYSMSNALSELSGDNTLEAHDIKINIRKKVAEELNTFQTKIQDGDANMMSIKELGKLHQYPTSELQGKFKDMMESKSKTEVDIPKSFTDPKGIHVGVAEVRGEKIDVYVPTDDYDELMMSRVFIGSPRMGKDTAIVNFVVEAALKGFGSVVLDVVNEQGNDRGMSDSIRDALDPEQIIDLDISNVDFAVYLGLNEIVQRSKNAGNRLASDMATIFEVEDSGRTRTYLREAIKACDGELLDVRLLLLSEGKNGDFLEGKIKELKKDGKEYAAAFWEAYAAESKGQKSEIRKPILNRLDEIFGDDHLKNMFGQKVNHNIDFAKWLKEGKVILLRVPNNHPDLSELAVKTICQWVVLKTFLTKMAMADKDCPSFLVLNEPHQFLSDGLVKVLGRMLRECPKWRLSMLFAIHDFAPSTVPRELVEALLSASLNWHIFKNTNDKVYDRLKQYLQPTYTPDDAMNQTERFHSINVFFRDGKYHTPFMMKALMPVNKRRDPKDNSFLTKRHLKMYGRTKEEVEKEIFEKEKVLFMKKKNKA